MSTDKQEENVAKGGASAEGTTPVNQPKVSRRGIGAARGTTRLKFDNRDAQQNGLFLGHMASVEVKDITIGEDTTGMPTFNGLTIPKLVMAFNSNDADATKRKYIELSFNAVESNTETIPGGKQEWKVNQIFDYLKHVLNVYVLKGRELTPEEEAALSLAFEDFDEDGQYVPVDAETVIAGWRALFDNFATMMNTGREGAPVFKTKEGKAISVWIKLLRHIKSGKKGWMPVNNGDLAFPAFVGEGSIEVFKQGIAPAIRVDLVKETIQIRNDEKPKTPNMPGAGIGSAPGIGGGIPMDNGGMPSMPQDFGAGMGDDLPF